MGKCFVIKRDADTKNGHCMSDPEKWCDCLEEYKTATKECRDDPTFGSHITAYTDNPGRWAETCGKEEKGCMLIYTPANQEYGKCVQEKVKAGNSYCSCVKDFIGKTWDKCEADPDIGPQLKDFKERNENCDIWGNFNG